MFLESQHDKKIILLQATLFCHLQDRLNPISLILSAEEIEEVVPLLHKCEANNMVDHMENIRDIPNSL